MNSFRPFHSFLSSSLFNFRNVSNIYNNLHKVLQVNFSKTIRDNDTICSHLKNNKVFLVKDVSLVSSTILPMNAFPQLYYQWITIFFSNRRLFLRELSKSVKIYILFHSSGTQRMYGESLRFTFTCAHSGSMHSATTQLQRHGVHIRECAQ